MIPAWTTGLRRRAANIPSVEPQIGVGELSLRSNSDLVRYTSPALCTTIAVARYRNRGGMKMRAGVGPKPLVIALAVVVAAIIAYWGYITYKKREFDTTTIASVEDASQRLRSALTLTAGPPGAITLQAAEGIGTDAEEVGRQLQVLKRADTASDMTLVDAADSYLVTVRELLKRIADMHKQRLMLADSTQALRNHLRVDTRTGAWVSEAVRGKARMDKDFRGLRIETEVVDRLLQSLHESQSTIAPYVGAAALIDEKLVADARQRANAELKRAAAENKSFRLR